MQDLWIVNMIQLIPSEDIVSISRWIPITNAYRYELKPTKNQEVKSIKTLGTCRTLYNNILGHRKDTYKKNGWSITYNDQQNDLPELRKNNKDLQDIYEQVEQNVVNRVDVSYKNLKKIMVNQKKIINQNTINQDFQDSKEEIDINHLHFLNMEMDVK